MLCGWWLVTVARAKNKIDKSDATTSDHKVSRDTQRKIAQLVYKLIMVSEEVCTMPLRAFSSCAPACK
jgi:hypothetical protein